MQASSVAVTDRHSAPPLEYDSRQGKYLIFQLDNEEYGVAVLKVREIMKLQEITAVPQTPSHVKGVINLRGKVIPVIDLRMRFGLPDREYTEHTCIVVIRTTSPEGEMLMGAIVDGVVEVLSLNQEDIEDTPDFGVGADTPYILGMAKAKGKVRILLDIDRALSSQDLHGLRSLIQ